jgi:hypothetical protein
VKLLHPDWAEEDIEAEVKRILDDQGAGPMPFFDEEEEGMEKEGEEKEKGVK